MIQNTIELDTYKADFVRRVLVEVDDIHVLERMDKLLTMELNAVNENVTKYVANLRNRIAKSEEDIAGGRVYSLGDVKREMETKFPWLTE